MKRIFAALLASAMFATAFTACSGGSSTASSAAPAAPAESAPAASTAPAESAPAASGETYKIYMISMDQMDQHWVNMDKGCQKAVAELGNVDYKWSAPDVKDDAKQIECINNAVADGAQAILLAANGPDADRILFLRSLQGNIQYMFCDRKLVHGFFLLHPV